MISAHVSPRYMCFNQKDYIMKTTTKLLPIALATIVLAGTGAMFANAQTTEVDPNAPAATERADHKRGEGKHSGKHEGKRGERGERGGKDSKRGERGGREMFRTIFTQMDADKDGTVTQAEIDTYRAAKVGTADVSGDGALSIEEFNTLYQEFTRTGMVRAFQHLDTDGDGVISAVEMDTRIGKMVERMDRNNDDALSDEDRGRRG